MKGLKLNIEIIKIYDEHEKTEIWTPYATVPFDDGIVTLGINGKYQLVWITKNELKYIESDIKCYNYHYPALVKFEQGFGIIDGGNTLYYYESIDSLQKKIAIENHEIFSTLKEVPRMHLRKTVGVQDKNHIIFTDSVLSQNPKFIGELIFDIHQESIKWKRLLKFNCDDFPYDHSEKLKDSSLWPNPGSTLIKDDRIFIFFEGSSSLNVDKHGMDYFSLVEIDEDGKIIDRLYEISGLQKKSCKDGTYGSFSSSKDYLILTPAFKSGEWKGKQKLFDLNTKNIIDVELPKSIKGFEIMDHFNNVFYLAEPTKKKIALCVV